MRKSGIAAIISVFAACAAGTIAGCAGTAPQAREGEVEVARVERLRWDLPPEPGLFRVRFAEALAGEIRRAATQLVSAEDVDYYYAEIRVLEEQAERELLARGLCSGAVKLASEVDGADGRGAIGGLFRCGVSILR